MKKKMIKKILFGLGVSLLVTGGIIGKTTTVSAETNNYTIEEFFLDSEKINELWMGDKVRDYIDCGASNLKKYTCIEGESIEILTDEWGNQEICAVREGYSKVKIEYRDYIEGMDRIEENIEVVETKIYEFNVLEEKDIEFIGVPNSIKVGEQIDYKIINANYGCRPGIYISEPNNSFSMPGSGGGAQQRVWPGHIFTAVKYDYNGELHENCNNVATIALYPGSYSYGMYENMDYDAIKAGTLKPVETGILVVEEPVITTNVPEVIKLGSYVEFKTGLENLYMEDEEILKLFEGIYSPEIVVLEGEDCIKRSEQVYGKLSTTEKIEFVKNGTVKLQIKYIATMPSEEEWSNSTYSKYIFGNEKPILYTAEKTISIKITDEEEKEENVEKENSKNDNNKADRYEGVITESEAESLEKGVVVEGVEKNDKIKIGIVQGESDDYKLVEKNKSVLGSKYMVMDIRLTREGKEIQPKKMIKITMPVMEKLKNAKYIEVFRVNSDKSGMESLGIVCVKDGKVTFETNHFSTYVFVERMNSNENPKTSDGMDYANFIMCILSMVVVSISMFSNKKLYNK